MLGFSHPNRLLEELTSSELSDWMAFEEVEPFGPVCDDLRHGQQMVLTANINRNTKIRPTPFTAVDFMFSTPKNEKVAEETEEQRLARIDREIFGV